MRDGEASVPTNSATLLVEATANGIVLILSERSLQSYFSADFSCSLSDGIYRFRKVSGWLLELLVQVSSTKAHF
jgi:hypothetical protein